MSGELETNILFIGASVRELMAWALDEGIPALGIDLFADRDSLEFGPVNKVDRFENVPEVFEQIRDRIAGIIVAGGFENRTRLLNQLPSSRLVGCDANSIAKCKDPLALFNLLTANSIFTPQVHLDAKAPMNSVWLKKPLRGCGGAHIQFWNGEEFNLDCYLQQFVEGTAMSATYFAERNTVHLVGTTRQLIGHPQLTKVPFGYCGSIGPIQINSALTEQLETIGKIVRRGFLPFGFFGVDFVLQDDRIWVIEINPRFTSSLEILRRSLHFRPVYSQLNGVLTFSSEIQNRPTQSFGSHGDEADKDGKCHGKVILFNLLPSSILVSESLSNWLFEARYIASEVVLGDIPFPGTTILPEHPIVTIYASSCSSNAVLEKLLSLCEKIMEEIKNRCSTID